MSEPAVLSTVPPTERQLEVLRAIDKSIREEGYPPTLRELCGQLGVLSTNAVASIIEPLIKKGFVIRKEFVSRGLRITDAGRAELAKMQNESRSA